MGWGISRRAILGGALVATLAGALAGPASGAAATAGAPPAAAVTPLAPPAAAVSPLAPAAAAVTSLAAPVPDPAAAVQRALPPGDLVLRAAAGDLDGDGTPEIAVFVREPAGTWRTAIHAARGAERWRRPIVPIEEGELRADLGTIAIEPLGGKGGTILVFSLPLLGGERALRNVYRLPIGGPPVLLYEGITGAERGEYGRSLELHDVNADGEREVVVYQTGETARLCDGSPARIYPRILNRDSGKLELVTITPDTRDLPKLTATIATDATRPSSSRDTLKFYAASSSPGFGGSPAAIRPPAAAGDGKPTTPWFEGDPRHGPGSWILAHVLGGRPLRSLEIVPGDASDAKAWKKHNRLREAIVVTGSGLAGGKFLVTFPKMDKAGAVRIDLPSPIETPCLALVIVSVWEGTEKNLTAIGEVSALTDLDFLAAKDRVALFEKDLDLPGPRAAAAARGLLRTATTPMAKGEPPDDAAAREAALRAIEEVLRGGPGPRSKAVLEAMRESGGAPESLFEATLSGLASPDAAFAEACARLLVERGAATVPVLAAHLATDASRPELRRPVIDLLGRLAKAGATSALPPLLDLFLRAVEPDRARVVGALEASGPIAHAPLVRLLAEREAPFPDPTSMAALVAAIPRPPEALPPALVARAVTVLVGWTAAPHPFALRGQACRALARFPGDASVDALALAALKDPEEVIREHALVALTSHLPKSRPAAVIARALDDRDPRVRRAALREAPVATADFPEALAEARVRAVAILESDPWPDVRRLAALTLAELGGDATGPALVRAMSDPDVDVAVEAMKVAARLAPTGVASALEALLADETIGARRRIGAAMALGDLGAGAAAPALVRVLHRHRLLAVGDMRAEELAQAAAVALGAIGRRSPPAAKEARILDELTTAIVDGPTDPLRTACAWALGDLGDKAACEILIDARDNAPDAATRKEAARSVTRLGCEAKP